MSPFIYTFIIVAGALQSLGNAMNAQFNKSLVNPWLAGLVSFVPIVCVIATLLLVQPRSLPTAAALAAMPWWAPLGGMAGAVAVFAGLLLTRRIGAGPFSAFLISSNLVFSVLLDHFGWVGLPVHSAGLGRIAGTILMVAGIALISIS